MVIFLLYKPLSFEIKVYTPLKSATTAKVWNFVRRCEGFPCIGEQAVILKYMNLNDISKLGDDV